MKLSPLAGKRPKQSQLVDVSKLISAYYANIPNPSVPEERVVFGTSGHRGSSLRSSFNEHHILAITQAIVLFRAWKGITGPLFLGFDTHALSIPAYRSALEVLAANQVPVLIAAGDEFTPTPVISHAILAANRGKNEDLSDGIVVTPSHNPPDAGGFKYDPPNGGGADTAATSWIEAKANELLAAKLSGVLRMPFEKALESPTVHRHDFLSSYVEDLENVVDMALLRESKITIGIDPLGGAGVHYWKPIALRYGLKLTVVDRTIDPTFGFLTFDWDGKIRMDPSSPYAMQKLIDMKDHYAIAAGCDPDHDRHGIVTKTAGLLPPNHFLPAAIWYLFQHRPKWNPKAKIGKTLVSSQMIDRVAAHLKRGIYEVPVGFKWFVDGLFDGSLAFAGEESAGAVFARFDGSVWTTDKDGIVMALLAAEMTARLGIDPGALYADLVHRFGRAYQGSSEAPAGRAQKEILRKMTAEEIRLRDLAGEKIEKILTNAPGNGAPIGGVKVVAKNGWFAARPSGTEDIYKIYAESFISQKHVERILAEAQIVVDRILGKT